MSPGLTDVETWLCCLCIDEAKHIELYFSLSITSHQLLLLVCQGGGGGGEARPCLVFLVEGGAFRQGLADQ